MEDNIDVKVEDSPSIVPDLEVKVEGEEKEEPKVEPKVEPKDEPLGDLASQFKELQAQAERDREARLTAERQAQEAHAERERVSRESQETIADSEANAIAVGIAAAETEAKAAEAAYKSAFEAGDAVGMATAQRQMARAEARAISLEEKKAAVEGRRARTAEGRQEQDPVDAFIAGRTPATADWLRAHRDWITDPRKNAKLTAAHWNAVGEGMQVDTPAYFESVETFIGLRRKVDERPRTSNGQFARQTPPAAPVVATGGGTSGGGTEVRLTRGEAQAAVDGSITWNYDDPKGRFKKGDVIGVQEYARRKLAMQKQGAYDRAYTDQ